MTNVCPVNDWLQWCRVKSWKKVKIIYLRWEFNQFQFVYLSNGFILKKEILFSAVLMFSLRKRKFFHSWCTMKEVQINKNFFCANVNLLLWVLQFYQSTLSPWYKKNSLPFRFNSPHKFFAGIFPVVSKHRKKICCIIIVLNDVIVG